jgi:hypothetical protein
MLADRAVIGRGIGRGVRGAHRQLSKIGLKRRLEWGAKPGPVNRPIRKAGVRANGGFSATASIPESAQGRPVMSTDYGSDALAGVVNFKMKRDFEGIEIDQQVGGFHHDQQNSFAREGNSTRR